MNCPSPTFPPLALKMGNTRQHDIICIGYRNFSRSKFQVQIAENVQTHSQIRFESSAVFEIKVRAEAFASARVVCLLPSLNRSLSANKVRDHGGHRRVETNHVPHAAGGRSR